MADTLDLFTGILLTVIGLVLVYGSIRYRLIDLVLIIGVLITIFGLYKLLSSFISRLLSSRRPRSRKKLKNSDDPLAGVMESVKEVEELVNAKLDSNSNSSSNSKSKSVLKSHDSKGSLEESSMTLDEYLSSTSSKEPSVRYDTPVDESKQVLRTKPVKEEKPKFKLPSIRKSNKEKKRSYGYLKDGQKESSPDTVYFTPNYEKPMKVTRRPRKKTEKLDLSKTPKRSGEISKALASVGEAETIYDNEVSDDSYSLMPKTIDEEIIMPIDEIDLSEGTVEEPIYNLSQSENTLYNNEIYDDSDDGVITPIYADEVYREEHGISDDDIYQEYEESSDYLFGDEEGDLGSPDSDYIAPEMDVDNLPRPTSIASTNPIPSKRENAGNLSRPHKKSEAVAAPKPKAKAPTPVTGPGESVGTPMPRPAPKAEAPKESDVPSIEELEELLAGPEIPESSDDTIAIGSNGPESLEDTIKIDPNDPESLPIPRLLNSYVICEKGILTSQEAFEEVASHAKEEILLEAPTVKDMGDRFLSSLSNIKSRVIIGEFDIEDISYVLLLSSLIKKGVEIKTLATVDSFNLIGDTSHALLISNSIDEEDFEYGAVYEDEVSVENIKKLFESSWQLANDLDINAIVENNN